MMKRLFLTAFVVLIGLVAVAQHSASSEESAQNDPQIEATTTPATSTELLIQKLEAIAADPVGRVVLTGCAFALFLSVPLLMISLLIFLVMFIFKYDDLQLWFNRRAGAPITPQQRLDKRLWRFVPFYASFCGGCWLIGAMGSVTGIVLGIALPILCWRLMVGQRVALWGNRRTARWEMIYLCYAGMTIFYLILLFCWAVVLYGCFKLVETFVTAPSRYTCGECDYYDQGYCNYHCKHVSDDRASCEHFD